MLFYVLFNLLMTSKIHYSPKRRSDLEDFQNILQHEIMDLVSFCI